MPTALVTGSSGLIGSEGVTFLAERGWTVHGIDNNMRRDFFGDTGDTSWNLDRMLQTTPRFTHHAVDVRDRDYVLARLRGDSARSRLPLRRATVARPRRVSAIRRFRDQRVGDA